jgi:arylsulfatase A-like enzyme
MIATTFASRRQPCRLRRAAVPIVAAIALTAGCGPRGETPRPPERKLDVVLISLDTYRWDALGLNGGRPRPKTPSLDRFGSQAVNFTHLFVQVPHTLTSHASMLTGLYPDVHGALDNKSPLPPTIPTLAEVLGDSGYQTTGFVSCTWLKEKFGLSRGFDRYEVMSNLDHYTFAAEINERAFEVLESRRTATDAERRRPLFLFLHYYDAHSDVAQDLPYWSPEEYRDGAGPADGRFCDPEDRCATEYLLAADRLDRDVPPEEIEDIRTLYDAGVSYLDHQLGLLFEELQRQGYYDDALIVVTADHGEEFREHGRFIHAQIYDETMRVPLLIRFPGGEHGGRTVSTLAETTDLLPTILEVLAVAPPALVQGTSLLPALSGEGSRREVISQSKGGSRNYALRTRAHKLIHNFASGKTELYDLRSDPAEQVDLSAREPETARRLTRRLIRRITENRRLARQLAADRPQAETELTAEETARLKALGYLN